MWLREANVLTVREKSYVAPEEGFARKAFPSLMDKPTLYISVIVPSYKEEDRLPRMLDETLIYLERRQRREADFTYEVVIVDDGSPLLEGESTSRTTAKAMEFSRKYGSNVVRVLTLRQNRGKGYAVKTGMLHCRGDLCLMVDADGATRIADLESLEARIRQYRKASAGPRGLPNGERSLAIGSRHAPTAQYEQDVVVQRDATRNLTGEVFNLFVRILMPSESVNLEPATGLITRRPLNDTQCGFKLFTRGAARALFVNQHVDRWCFDVELMYLAKQLRLPVAEVPVTWSEVDGSHVDVIRDGIGMLYDMAVSRLMYITGVWSIDRTTLD